eukprot:g2187.t1
MEPGFISTLPRSVDLKAVELPQPCGPVAILIRYFGKEFEIECEPSEGWEMLRMQIYSMTEVPPEQMKLFGLGLDAGMLMGGDRMFRLSTLSKILSQRTQKHLRVKHGLIHEEYSGTRC